MRDRDACSWLLTQTRQQEPSAEDTTHLSDWIQRNEGTTHLSDRIQRNEGTTHFVYKTHKKNQVSIELESTCWLTFTVLEGALQATSRENSAVISCLLQYFQARYAHWGIVAGL